MTFSNSGMGAVSLQPHQQQRRSRSGFPPTGGAGASASALLMLVLALLLSLSATPTSASMENGRLGPYSNCHKCMSVVTTTVFNDGELMRCMLSLSSIFTNLHPSMVEDVIIMSPAIEGDFLRALLHMGGHPRTDDRFNLRFIDEMTLVRDLFGEHGAQQLANRKMETYRLQMIIKLIVAYHIKTPFYLGAYAARAVGMSWRI
jgi:hypothetical protein